MKLAIKARILFSIILLSFRLIFSFICTVKRYISTHASPRRYTKAKKKPYSLFWCTYENKTNLASQGYLLGTRPLAATCAAQSGAVADVHRKSALCRASFESPEVHPCKKENHITFLVHLLGRRGKTVNNCFSEAETAQSKELAARAGRATYSDYATVVGEPASEGSEVRDTEVHESKKETI